MEKGMGRWDGLGDKGDEVGGVDEESEAVQLPQGYASGHQIIRSSDHQPCHHLPHTFIALFAPSMTIPTVVAA